MLPLALGQGMESKRREGGHGGGHDSVCVPTRADAALIPVGQSHHRSHCRTQSTHLTYVQYWIEIGVDPWMSSSMTMIIHGWCWWGTAGAGLSGLWVWGGGANAGQRWKTCRPFRGRCPRKRRHLGSASSTTTTTPPQSSSDRSIQTSATCCFFFFFSTKLTYLPAGIIMRRSKSLALLY